MADLTPVVVAGAASAVALPVVHAMLRRRGVIDAANDRSSHSGTAIRGLGVACVLGWLVAAPFFAGAAGVLHLALLVGPVAIALVGFADDTLGGVPAAVRFGATAAAAGLITLGIVDATTAAMWWVILGLVWITYFTNAFNFMDGIDGISAATVVVMGSAYAWLARDIGSEFLAQVGLALAAASLGFAVLNILGRGKFLGDAGSYFFGAALGTLALALFLAGAGAVAVASVAAVYVADTATAIVRRAIRRAAITEAHREHAYQRLVDGALSHTAVVAFVGAATLASSMIGIGTDGSSTSVRLMAAAGVLLVVAAYLTAPLAIRGLAHRKRESLTGGR